MKQQRLSIVACPPLPGIWRLITWPELIKQQLLFTLRITGLHFVKTSGTQRKLSQWQFVYCSAILVVIVTAVLLRYGTLYHYVEAGINSEFYSIVILNLWFLLCIGNLISMYKASQDKNAFPAFIQLWNGLADKSSLACVRRKSCILCALSISFHILSIGVIGYQLFWSSYRDQLVLPIKPYTTLGLSLKGVILFISILCLAPWILPTAFALLIGQLISYEYSKITKQLENMWEEGNVDAQKMKNLREAHQHLNRLVWHVDNMFTIHVASTLLFNIGIICIILVFLTSGYLATPRDIILSVYWLLLSLFMLSVTLVSGAKINDEVNILYSYFCLSNIIMLKRYSSYAFTRHLIKPDTIVFIIRSCKK